MAAVLVAFGATAIGYSLANQRHAPAPAPSAAGVLASPGRARAEPPPPVRDPQRVAAEAQQAAAVPREPFHLGSSRPVSIAIPAIKVHSVIQTLGVNPNGTIEVPPLGDTPKTNEAAWFKYSATPGQLGVSVIEGHIDSAFQGPSVFFELGKLAPGDRIYVALADRVEAVFTVRGVRQYQKKNFPTGVFYGNPGYAALHLVTCGGAFDPTDHQYLSSIIVVASLTGARPIGRRA